MEKEINYSGFNKAIITYYYPEIEAVKCNLCNVDEFNNIINEDTNIVFKQEQYPFILTDEDKQILIQEFYGFTTEIE
jgi:hypothetical protein